MIKNYKKLLISAVVILIMVLSAFSQTDSRYDADKNLPFNEKAGDVNPQTGNISLNFTDVNLPGRAGYNFTFGRIWSLNQSNVFNMYYKDGNNRLNSNTVEKYNKIGTGWSSTLPYIMENFDSVNMVLNLFYAGEVYEIDQTGVQIKNLNKSNILGYDLLDLRIYEESSVNYGMFDAQPFTALKTTYGLSDNETDMSRYELLLKSNEKYYFRNDGKLMMQEDRTGLNRIWYFYESVSGQSRLRVVVDTTGKEIEFIYDTNGNLSKIQWQVEIGVKNTDGTRSSSIETRSIEYTYNSGEDYQNISFIKNNVLDYITPYVLSEVKDQMGNVTKFNYIEGLANFTFDKTKSHTQNVYLMITEIIDKYTEQDGEYKNKRCFEYEVPADGMYTKWFYTGYMEHYRITKQYNINRHGRTMNEITYAYYDVGEAGNYNQYTAVVISGGLKYTYTYTLSSMKSQDHVLDKLQIESTDGFLELKDYVYDSERKKTLDEVYRLGKFVYREQYTYDSKGNLKRFEDRVGLVTVITYDDIFSMPLTEQKSVHVNGILKVYDKVNTINSIGQVTKETIYIEESGIKRGIESAKYRYDIYGNVIEKEDADGNILYTVYDDAVHTYPVKIYQDVDIAAYSAGGDIHVNWQNEPDTTQKVRIRSWKVFNSDGSLWIEVDNEGYAIEHYYDKNGQEIEAVNPDLDDERSFAQPIVIINGSPQGTDFNNFKNSSYFNSFLASRTNNPGVRNVIDYQDDLVTSYVDIDKVNGDIKVTGKQGDGAGHVEKEIEYTYIDINDLTEYSVKRMDYDDYGRMVGLTDPDAGEHSVPISVNGVTIDRHDKTWVVKYDDLGRQVKILYPETGNRTDVKVINYDDYNNTVTTVDPAGRKVLEKYDWNGSLVQVTRYGDNSTPSDKVEIIKFEYDELNRKTSFTDAKNIETIYRYDERNLLVEQVYSTTGSDKMTYNDLGQLVKKTDRKGNVITFTYDQMGRNTKSTHYTSIANFNNNTIDHEVVLAYDNRGNAVRIANQNLIEHYIYDYANRVIKLERKLKDTILANDISTRTGLSNIYSFEYIYNDAGMVKSMIYPDGSIHDFDYDGILGRLESINENSNGFVNNFSYNKSGVVTQMDYANNTQQNWEFDNRKRIKHILIGSTGQSTIIADMSYTLNGVGDILSINDNQYKYDGFDRIIYAKTLIPESINQVDIQNLVVDHFGSYENDTSITAVPYNVNADLNIDGRINGFDHIMASFDNMQEEYDEESFEYDKNGNRTKLVQNGDTYTYTYGELNKLVKIELQKKEETVKTTFAEYQYDANGNTIKRTIYTDTETRVIDFEYDTMNRLVKTTSQAGHIEEYFYDNAGNRFIKKTDTKTTIYLRHGQIAVAVDVELYDNETTDNATVNRYVLSGDLLAGRITTKFLDNTVVSTEKFWYHLDHLNSTKAVTRSDGSLECLYEYRAFGEELKKLGDGDAKYTYSGKELDTETNLYYFNARYYDATIGRFINVDPIQDGYNWYVYCNNNPLSFIDPTGLISKAGWTVGITGIGISIVGIGISAFSIGVAADATILGLPAGVVLNIAGGIISGVGGLITGVGMFVDHLTEKKINRMQNKIDLLEIRKDLVEDIHSSEKILNYCKSKPDEAKERVVDVVKELALEHNKTNGKLPDNSIFDNVSIKDNNVVIKDKEKVFDDWKENITKKIKSNKGTIKNIDKKIENIDKKNNREK